METPPQKLGQKNDKKDSSAAESEETVDDPSS